ncbi:MAG: hypothetical protein ACI3W5_16185 [Faecousia sp.]
MRLIRKMDYFLFQTKLKVEKKVNDFLYDEKGDTNFISIMVLLGIGLALAAVFLGLKDEILKWVDDNMGSFFGKSASYSFTSGAGNASGSNGGGFR